ncbi:MAG: hypothetical protein RR319_01345 [Bacteroides sp.]
MEKPELKDEERLISIDKNKATKVNIPRSKDTFNVRWIKPYASERITKLAIEHEKNKAVMKKIDNYGDGTYSAKDVHKLATFSSKLASLCLLNGSKIFFIHWIYWRWLYYVKGYDYKQLEAIINTAKKKTGQGALFLNTISGVQMKITGMTMTKEEASLFRAELTKE